MFDSTFGKLQKALESGFNKPFASIAYNTPDWEYIQNLRYNTAVFSAFKQNDEITEAYKLLTDEKGNQRSWKEFYTEARKQSETYNRTWLQTEFNQASQAAVTARQWREFEENADLFPNLKYKTVKDENVRESHKVLHNKIYPINHSFWDTYYPPNGWGCRCTVEQTDEQADEELPERLPGMPEYMKNNTGKTAKVWDETHPYYNTSKSKEVLDFVHQQIKPATDVMQAFDRFQKYGSVYKKLSFNGNNGGYQVAHHNHQFHKVGGKYEKAVGKKLEAIGKEVEFMAEQGTNRLDIKINGEVWEIKGTKAKSSKAVKELLKKANNQGAEKVIFHMDGKFDYEAFNKGIGRALGAGDEIPEVWYFNKDGKLINRYKKSQP